jgi:outer membrane receptor protein involved in Fe transport
MKIYYFILTLFFCSISFAQNSISGSVKDSKNEPIPGANIKVSGETSGTVTDGDGKFILKTSKKLPVTIEVSNIGFTSQKMQITTANQKVNVVLQTQDMQLDDIVISASRTPERVKESPVTIERMGIKDIKKSASPTFYDGLENLKEVQMNTSSMSFKSINTRGFATVANTRFMQLVDGMDNSSPLLNFVIGNMIGISEVDVQSVELLPGASSALYGANAFNGILFMNSKSPFTSQGITSYVKYGQTSQKAAGTNDYADYGVRVAHAFDSHFAAKANFTFLKATDWFATDYRDKDLTNNSGKDRGYYNYNGINVYGDEVSTNLKGVGQALAGMGLIPASAVNLLPSYNVSRTGYNEVDLTDNKVRNSKIDFSLHFRPFGNEKLEIIWQSKFGFGNTVYQGANRYYLNDFFMEQHKLEFKGKNFFVRGYTTTEDGGKSYDMLFTGINVNRAWKSDATWFGQYAGQYITSTLGGATPDQAHAAARTVADSGRLIPGTDAFKAAFNNVISNPDVLSGSKLVDNSRIYHSDANYNFKNDFKPVEIQVGGSLRQYQLNSHGRIYTDAEGPIYYNEFGMYTQAQKKLLEDRLKLTGSVRYDKSKNFEGNYSPRLSAVYSVGERKNHTFRGSFQTGFRNPSTQDQYIGFNVGSAVLVGSAADNLERYKELLDVTPSGIQYLTPANSQVVNGVTKSVMKGTNAYQNSFTSESFASFQGLSSTDPVAAATYLRKANINLVKPETVKAFELGYRGDFKGFSFDINGYYNIYNNFIGNLNVVAPYYGTASDAPTYTAVPTLSDLNGQAIHALSNGNYRAYQVYTNTDIEIKSLGFGIGVAKKVYKDFEVGANYNYAQFDFDQAKDPSFQAGFNTPKHRVKASFGNEKLFKNFGFNVSGRWNTSYLWESTFITGTIPSATVVDAQINYSIPKLKSVIKLGAANIGGKEYQQVLGAGLIGQQYFASLTINP